MELASAEKLSDFAAAFALATVLAFAAHITRIATALALAAIHALAIVFVRRGIRRAGACTGTITTGGGQNGSSDQSC